MKRFGLVFVLLLVFALGAVASAKPIAKEAVEFNVYVAPHADLQIISPEPLEILKGEASGKITTYSKITTNFPFKLTISTTRVRNIKDDPSGELNNWFYYTFSHGEHSIIAGNPGVGATTSKWDAGIYELQIDFEVKSTHSRGVPIPREWYSLLAGDYSSIATLTLEAAE